MGAFLLDWVVVLLSATATVLESVADTTADKEDVAGLSTGLGLGLDVENALELFCVEGAGAGVMKEVDKIVCGS